MRDKWSCYKCVMDHLSEQMTCLPWPEIHSYPVCKYMYSWRIPLYSWMWYLFECHKKLHYTKILNFLYNFPTALFNVITKSCNFISKSMTLCADHLIPRVCCTIHLSLFGRFIISVLFIILSAPFVWSLGSI